MRLDHWFELFVVLRFDENQLLLKDSLPSPFAFPVISIFCHYSIRFEEYQVVFGHNFCKFNDWLSQWHHVFVIIVENMRQRKCLCNNTSIDSCLFIVKVSPVWLVTIHRYTFHTNSANFRMHLKCFDNMRIRQLHWHWNVHFVYNWLERWWFTACKNQRTNILTHDVLYSEILSTR